MMKINYTITGTIPSKKNSRQCFVRGGRMINIPSKAYKQWHEEASYEIIQQGVKGVQEVNKVTMNLYAPNKRRADLSNKFESVADLLVDLGVLEDDNWYVVPEVHLYFKGVDKDNPRVLIEIE